MADHITILPILRVVRIGNSEALANAGAFCFRGMDESRASHKTLASSGWATWQADPRNSHPPRRYPICKKDLPVRASEGARH
ncbi:hypothetical protein RQ595_26955 [Pseudomonas aeruginosa]|uniref:hypothetical protein n=1 Tax=Pseudomonas aeruginosa TaxID=287 RepID=UPI0028CE58D6|nr:hypothetical protein [Pseudomonas aeruginosa]MDT8221974.1 hypothetical protein [Pseudomonas aeruginosa]